MKNTFKMLPLILVFGYLLFKAISNWENLNGLQLAVFAFIAIVVLYILFMGLTKKYIDFKDGLKIKKLTIKREKEPNRKLNLLYNLLYITGLIIWLVFLYNSIILNVQLSYLLYLLIGGSLLLIILKRTINSKRNEKLPPTTKN